MKNVFLTLIVLYSLMGATSAQLQLGQPLEGEAPNDLFGEGLSLSANGFRVAIGSRLHDNKGHVRVFDWDGDAWVQIGQELEGEAAFDQFGKEVSLSADGMRLAIGAALNDANGMNAGKVRVYAWDGQSWIQVGQDIVGIAPGNQAGSGLSLSADGQRLAVGEPQHSGIVSESGQVSIFEWTGSEWLPLGQPIQGTGVEDQIGTDIALSGNGQRLVIGAGLNDDNGPGAGLVRVFEWDGLSWQQAGPDIQGEAENDRFGNGVDISTDGNRIAAAAFYHDHDSLDAGQVRIFEWDGADWTLLGNELEGNGTENYFGRSISLSGAGDRIAIGSRSLDGSYRGNVKLYELINGQWHLFTNEIEGEEPEDRFGTYLDLSADGKRFAGASIYHSSNDFYAGQVRMFDLEPTSNFAVHLDREDNWKVFPNPTEGAVQVQGVDQAIIQILSPGGKLLGTVNYTGSALDLSGFPPGLYLLFIRSGQGSSMQKVVRQ